MNEVKEISAEVILKSKSGRSLVGKDVAITAENIEDFAPAPETVARATRGLQRLDFTVVQSGITLTIMGSPQQFETVFKVEITVEKDEETGNIIVHPEGEAAIPESLKDVVEGVVFPEPPEFFP